jgi:hypothetical protein
MRDTRLGSSAAGALLLAGLLAAATESAARERGARGRQVETVDSTSFSLTVHSGESDRVQTPVRVLLSLPASRASYRGARLRDPAGRTITGQLAPPGLLEERLAEAHRLPAGRALRELHFVLPRLESGKTLALRAEISDSAPGGDAFRWHDTPGDHAELRYGPRPVVRYMYRALDKRRRVETYKVFHHVFDPAGERIVTKGPGGRYTHHRGLFYGFNKVTYGGGKKVDIWHCKGDAHQAHARFISTAEGPVLGRHRVEVEWRGVGSEVFAREERELSAYHVEGGVLLEFASRLRAALPPVKLDGDPQHAGFHFRADDEVASKTSKETYYLRVDGRGKPRETRNWPGRRDHVNLPWNAMSFVLGGKRYTALYLDRPENPKEARFSERDYGRFGSYFEHTLEGDEPLEIAYRVWLQEGEMTVEKAGAKSADFTEPVAVGVR